VGDQNVRGLEVRDLFCVLKGVADVVFLDHSGFLGLVGSVPPAGFEDDRILSVGDGFGLVFELRSFHIVVFVEALPVTLAAVFVYVCKIVAPLEDGVRLMAADFRAIIFGEQQQRVDGVPIVAPEFVMYLGAIMVGPRGRIPAIKF